VSVEFSPEISEGEEIEVRKADGTLCISDQGCPELKWISVEITFCQVDPDLFTLFTGWDTVTDYAGDAVGNRVSSEVNCDQGVALELWTDIPNQVCTTTGAKKYGYFLLPWIVHSVLGDFTIENDAANFVLSGRTEEGSNWGTGPYNVDPADANNTPGKLHTAIGAKDHMDMHLTTIAPPAAKCGCQPLVIPPGP
jgi:hypothetical protein